MEWDSKTKIRVAVAAVVVLLFVVAGVIRLLRTPNDATASATSQSPEAPSAETTDTTENTAPMPTEPPSQPQSAVQDSEQAQLKRFALDFAARFGTYSTDAPNENIQQLFSRMTGELRVWASARLKETPVFAQAQRVTTRALSAKIISQSAIGAQVAVQTQRVYRDAQGERVVYEVATVKIRKSNAGYLVEQLQWKVSE